MVLLAWESEITFTFYLLTPQFLMKFFFHLFLPSPKFRSIHSLQSTRNWPAVRWHSNSQNHIYKHFMNMWMQNINWLKKCIEYFYYSNKNTTNLKNKQIKILFFHYLVSLLTVKFMVKSWQRSFYTVRIFWLA